MQCKLCGCDKKLVDAHIIPRSFHEPLKQGGETPIIITSKPGVYPKQSHIGVYDKEIVCEACEAIFSPWDDYGHKFLTQKLEDARFIGSNGERLAYNFGPCDYKNLKLFFLSVLWRAGASKQQLFNKVQLGPYEEKLRQVILSKEAGGVADFSIALSKFDAPANETGILNPDRTEYDGVNHYQLYLGGYMAIIKVSNQPPPKCFDGLYLAPNQDVYCIVRNFRESKEFMAMVHAVKKSRNSR
jgi:hypothetical protein